jgi:hypothetical protein
MFQYGALNRDGNENATLQRRNSRAWPLSTVMFSIMTATVLFLLWDGNGARISDVQPAVSMKLNVLHEKNHSKLSTHLNAKTTVTLASTAVPIYGVYVDDMPSRPIYFPSFLTLVQGSVKIDCSDTVAWGRLYVDETLP